MSIIELEDGWSKIYPAIENLVQRLWPEEGQRWEQVKINNTEYMTVFVEVYNMCAQKYPNNHADQLYERYKDTVNQVFDQNVLPIIDSCINASEDEITVVINDQWSRFRIFVKWISAFFSYLDRYHTKRMGLPGLRETGIGVFKDNLRQLIQKSGPCRLTEDNIDALEDK